MLTQVMLVGVGGSGGKTLRVLRQTLLRRLRQVGWTGDDLPQAWQMLWIDTISSQVSDGFPEKLLPADDYLGLVAPGVNWGGTLQSLVNTLSPGDRQPALSSWVPAAVPFEISKGAGQYRAVGRGVALSRLDVIVSALQAKYILMTAPRAVEELRSVARLMGFDAEANPPAPFALVVSSMAGGSGAGMFMDVAEGLKTVAAPFAANTHAILYGPDVFGNLPPGMAGGVAPNVLGAVNEVISGVRKESMDQGSQAIFASKGISAATGFGIGGKLTYLMGASNGSVSFGSQEDIYRAVGEALAPMVIDEAVQDWMNSFVLTNVFLNTGALDNIGDATRLRDPKNIQHRQILASLGFSRVGLGMDRFSDYAAEVLARESVAQLLWPREVPLDPREPKTEVELITERVEQAWPEFLARSGINERDPANDVVNALVPQDSSARLQSFASKCVERASAQVGEKGLDAQTWAQRLIYEYNTGLTECLSQETEARYHRAREWAGAIEERLLRHTTESAARHGLKVTAKLLERLRDEVRFVGSSELPASSSVARRHLDSMAGRISQDLNSGLSTIPPNHPSIEQARQWLIKGAELNASADRLDLAANLLKDLESNLLVVLERAVLESARALEQDISTLSADGSPSPYITWPTLNGPVPKRLSPGVTEKVLIDSGRYPNLLETLARQSVGQNATGVWQQRLISRSISGLPLDERGDSAVPTLIKIEVHWVPQDDRARAQLGAAAQRATAKIPTRAPEYVDRARRTILEDGSTNLGKFLAQDLETYLSTPDVAENAAREATFSAALAAALNASRPMTSVIPDVLPLIHPGQSVSSYLTSSVIPAAIRDLVQPVLDANGFGRGNAQVTYGDVKPQQIEFFQVPQKAYHPVVFETIMRPIAESWLKVQADPGLRDSWWRMRRARPLTEALPVTEDVLQSMVTGWFVAGLLGQRRSSIPAEAMGPLVEIADERGAWLKFPHPLLGFSAGANDHELLPSVLKSVGLALAFVAANKSLDPLAAYWRLLDLGGQHRDLLARWVREGQAPALDIIPNPLVAGSGSGDVESRREMLLKSLTATSEYFERLFNTVESNPSRLDVDRVWELRDAVRKALVDIRESVQNVVSAPPSDVVV